MKATIKEKKKLINNKTFLIDDQCKGDTVTPCMDVFKSNIQYDGSLETFWLRIEVRGEFQNMKLIGYTWAPTESMSTLKYFLVYSSKHKSSVHQLHFSGAFLQDNVNIEFL